MRILYFHQHFNTPNGTVGIRSYQMSQRLLSRGHQVTMVCGSYGGGDTGLTQAFHRGVRRGVVDGIDIVEFDLAYSNADGLLKRAYTFVKFAFKSIQLALTEKYDVLFATSTPLTAGIPGIFARWLRGKPFVFEVRDLWPELPHAMGVIRNPLLLGILSALEWGSYRSADRLIGLSPGIVRGIRERGVPDDAVAMIPNGCDLDIFAAQTPAWRPEQVKDTDLMAVFAGTHGAANGLDAVLDAAAELKRRGRQDVKLVLIGNGKLKPQLEQLAARKRLDNVVFLDPVNKTRLSGLMAASDVGLQILANVPAFYFGTSPNKFFDYIAAGLPVLNNYPGWLAEMLLKHRCGFAVPPKNASAFADALERAADNRDLLKTMGHNARQLAHTQFRRELLADQWVDWVTESE